MDSRCKPRSKRDDISLNELNAFIHTWRENRAVGLGSEVAFAEGCLSYFLIVETGAINGRIDSKGIEARGFLSLVSPNARRGA